MATFIAKKNGKVQVLIRKAGHKTQSKTLANKADAVEWAKTREREIDMGVSPLEKGKRTFEVVLKEYIPKLEERRLATEVTIIKQLEDWSEHLGSYSLNRLDGEMIEAAIKALRATGGRARRAEGIDSRKTDAAIIRRLSALRGFLRWCVKKKYLRYSPLSDLDVTLHDAESRTRYLSDSERERLFAACRESTLPALYPLVVTSVYTGCRISELLGLRWERQTDDDSCSYVDLERKIVFIGKSKNGTRREVPMIPLVENVLRAWRSHNGVTRMTGRVFGLTYNPYDRWNEAREKAGIKNLRLHDCRHSFCSYAKMSGSDLYDIAKMAGHKNIKTTAKYVHVSDNHLRSKLERMGEAFGGGVE